MKLPCPQSHQRCRLKTALHNSLRLALIHMESFRHGGRQRWELPMLWWGYFEFREGECPSEGASEGGVGRRRLMVLVGGGGSLFSRDRFGQLLTRSKHESAPNARFIGRTATWKNWSRQCERIVRMSVSTTAGRLPHALGVDYLSSRQLFDVCPTLETIIFANDSTLDWYVPFMCHRKIAGAVESLASYPTLAMTRSRTNDLPTHVTIHHQPQCQLPSIQISTPSASKPMRQTHGKPCENNGSFQA